MSKTRAEITRFAIAGVAGLFIDILVLYCALALGFGWYGGRAISFLTAVFATWQINRRYTFNSTVDISLWQEWWRYFLAMSGGGLVNYAAYSATIYLFSSFRFLPILAVAIGSLSGMIINFLGAKLFVFR